MSHQFDLTDDQLQIQDMARKFTADAITPFAAECANVKASACVRVW